MGCVADQTFYTDIGGSVNLCNLAVGAVKVGARVPVSLQATQTGVFPIVAGQPLGPQSDVITGVITEVQPDGTAVVVALLNTVTLDTSAIFFQGSSTTLNLQSTIAVPTSWQGHTLHVAVGPQKLFNYKVGQAFYADPTQMLRTSFAVAGAAGGAIFTLEVLSIPSIVQPGDVPSAKITVYNQGDAYGADTVSGVTVDSSGATIAHWTSLNTGGIPPGGARTVVLSMEAPIPSQYAGGSLRAVFSDPAGRSTSAILTVGGGATSTSGTSTSGTGTQPGTQTTPNTSSSILTPLLIGLGVALSGTAAVLLATRE